MMTYLTDLSDDLPIWLQYYPKILFDTINRSCSGTISKVRTERGLSKRMR